ncbi:hypothetical protein DOTSEDRAFT_38719 [Dothistroma septosporum NZE10]|uniref:Uncharacterized protein n=1 Tax=Dothistroma septosporum (strain NZE10 / CBS 128990) TaxID=675120 RepID=M2Y2N0_DOTSN|nr:hypothetical protein DOTSEDRAFT_38719 [Dothistroma septosporum NZE10]
MRYCIRTPATRQKQTICNPSHASRCHRVNRFTVYQVCKVRLTSTLRFVVSHDRTTKDVPTTDHYRFPCKQDSTSSMLSSCSANEEIPSFPLLIALAMAVCACCFLLAVCIVRVKEECLGPEPEPDSDVEAWANYEEDPWAYCVKPYSDLEEKQVMRADEKA